MNQNTSPAPTWSQEEHRAFEEWKLGRAATSAPAPAQIAAPVATPVQRVGTMTSGPSAEAVTLPAPAPRIPSGLTPSQEIVARYSRIERRTDGLGRMIGVKVLRPSQECKIRAMAETADLEVLNMLVLAASVVEIDGSPLTFPKSRAELDATLDGLDHEGVQAAMLGLISLKGMAPSSDAEAVTDAKN